MIDEIKRKNPISSPIGLQIDNLVYNQHGEMVTIRPNDFHRFMQPRMNGDYGIYGIPITSELLEQCGFERQQSYTYQYINSDLSYVFKISFVGDDKWYSINATTNVPIKYLHQLQNLFYCLLGEELTYNPNQP